MFGLGILSYIKIGIVLVILSVCGYYVWNYEHMKTKIAAQQIEIGNLKLAQDDLKKKQDSFDAFMAKKPVTQRRVKNEQSQIDQEVPTVDDAGLRALYDHYKLLPDGQVRPTPPGGSGRAKPAPGSPARTP